MTRLLWLAPAIALGALAQEKSAVTREGAYWVDTVTGSFAVERSLSVSTVGAVSVQGVSSPGAVTYSLKRRAKADSAAAARAILDRIAVRSSQRGGAAVIEVSVPGGGRASADLNLAVPRGLRETALVTSSGPIRAFDLGGALRADTRGGPIEIDRIQGAVTVRTGGGAVRLGRIGGKLECYSGGGRIFAESLGADAWLNTGGGEILVREARGMVHARTAGGNIRVERATHGVQVAAGSGLIDVVEAGGPVVAETGVGSIKIRSSSNVQCNSGAGTIHVQAVSGALRAATRSGSIVADLSGARQLETSSLTTNAGDITVLIPSNLPVTVEAVNSTPGMNRIISDFAEIRPRAERENGRSAAHGSLGGGGPVLRLTTAAGTIYLRREK
ncbi:MAG: DUF4097 family beta strand repeat-containing protein [Acidobacteriota bacterium]